MAEAPDVNRLCSATARGDLGETQLILQSNADVNKRNMFDRTPLQVVKLSRPDVAEVLLKAQADPNVRDPVKGLTVAHDAAREGFTDMLYMLVKYGADVNLKDGDGNLPLHLAAREGHLGAVRYLVDVSVQPYSRNRDNLTPLDLALAHRREDTAQWLQTHCPPQPQSPA
ncbi:cyclin-dependent kinase 4 inhibitor C [Hoplias malabaricus]|uniref:cyclin-dependent kinase 4 inhibitor C n=1 Tax=Hoplias malabaricus TaxID=27720 RepID=UPI003462CEA6